MAETITREMTLLNKYGLHVRPAGLFAKTASRFDAEVNVDKDGNVVSGKSIMALMTLEAVSGTVLKVTASGPQAKEALDELEALVARKFDIPDEQYPSDADTPRAGDCPRICLGPRVRLSWGGAFFGSRIHYRFYGSRIGGPEV